MDRDNVIRMMNWFLKTNSKVTKASILRLLSRAI